MKVQKRQIKKLQAKKAQIKEQPVRDRARLKKLVARLDKVEPAEDTWRPRATPTRRSVEKLLGQQDDTRAAQRAFDALTAKATAQAEAQAARQHKAAIAASRKRSAEH